jgi:spermidine synthase
LKKTADGGIRAVVVATGIASVAVQLVLVREYLAQFQGNEIVIALIFFCWLVFGGIGTALARVREKGGRIPTAEMLALLSLLLAMLSVGQVVAIRRLRDLVFIHGASVGFYPTLGFVAATMLPYAILVGFVLPYSLMVVRQRMADYPGNWIYMADNAGDVAGGALFSFALVYWLPPFQLLFAVHLPLLAALSRLENAFSRRTVVAGILSILVLTTGCFLEQRLLPVREGRRVYYAESRYGRIEVIESQGEVTIFNDGVPRLFSRDPALAEECVHFPLVQIARPRRVLLVSAVGGMAAEVAKYHPDRVDYVELDPLVAQVQQRFGLLAATFGMRVITQDARAFLASTSMQYDAILVGLPEPETYQVNRFYTAEFFALVKNHLAPEGVFSFGIHGVENYISEVRQQKLSSLANTAGRYFKHVLLMPGQRLVFVCRNQPLRTDIARLLEQKGIETDYLRRYFGGDFTAQRIHQLNAAVDASVPFNLDLFPRLMQLCFIDWFVQHGESPFWFAMGWTIVALAYLWRITRPQWVLLTTGAVNMGSEMVTIFTFQALYGYIYLQIGVLVTVFLAGLLPGAWVGGRLVSHRRRALMVGDLLLCLLLLSFAVLLSVARARLPAGVLYGFGLTVSFCCGFQFPLALMLSGDSPSAVARSFSADLVGAAGGVLLVSLVLIPFLGLLWSTLSLAMIKLVSLMIAGSIHETH